MKSGVWKGSDRPMNRSIFQTDHAALVSRADLIYRQPVEHGRQGQPIGNGRMGTMVWTTPDTVRFRINRSDVFAVNKDHKGDKYGPTDYWGGCARISVDVGGDAFRGSEGFAQHLSPAVADGGDLVADGGDRRH